MKQTVINWLKNPDRHYGDGVSLFEAIASDTMKGKYLSYFRNHEDIHLLSDKIRRCLHLIVPGCKPPLSISLPVKVEFFKKPVTISVLPNEDNQPLFDRISEIRPLQAHLHATLHAEANPEKRKEAVDELLKLEQERKEIWNRIDGAAESGNTPEIQENPVERGARLQKRLKQLRQNIARGKCSPAKKAAYETELAAIMNELNPSAYGTQ